MLSVKNVSMQMNGQTILDDISLNFKEGRTTALIGPSGCGKSTLLRVIIGLLQPDAGKISFDGESLSSETIQQMRHEMGYVIQEGGLFPHLTAKENVTLMVKHLGWTEHEIRTRLKELSELTKLQKELLDRYPRELSGGQRQRIALMRALMLKPKVLLLDEPMGALDPMIRSELQSELKTIFDELSQTVIIVTHDMGEACYLGDNILIMKDGNIIQQGNIETLIHEPKNDFVANFINAQRSPLEGIH